MKKKVLLIAIICSIIITVLLGQHSVSAEEMTSKTTTDTFIGSDEVDIASGSVHLQFNDLLIPGYEPSINIGRNYYTTPSSSTKANWSYSFEANVTLEETYTNDGKSYDIYKVVLPDGKIIYFSKCKDNDELKPYSPEVGYFTIAKEDSGGYRIKTRELYTFIFDSNNYLVRILDKNGKKLSIERSEGKVIGLRDYAERHYTVHSGNSYIDYIMDDTTGKRISYEETTDCKTVTDFQNNKTYYFIDSTTKLLKKIEDNNHNILKEISYYPEDSSGQKDGVILESLNGFIKSMKDEYGRTRDYNYTKAYKVVNDYVGTRSYGHNQEYGHSELKDLGHMEWVDQGRWETQDHGHYERVDKGSYQYVDYSSNRYVDYSGYRYLDYSGYRNVDYSGYRSVDYSGYRNTYNWSTGQYEWAWVYDVRYEWVYDVRWEWVSDVRYEWVNDVRYEWVYDMRWEWVSDVQDVWVPHLVQVWVPYNVLVWKSDYQWVWVIDGYTYVVDYSEPVYKDVSHEIVNKCEVTDESGDKGKLVYDFENNISDVKDYFGNKLRIASRGVKSYTDAGRRVTTLQYYDNLNLLKSISDRNGNSTSYGTGSIGTADSTDAYGHYKKIINPDNTYKVFDYDNKGNLTFEQDENGNCTLYVFTYNGDDITQVEKIQAFDNSIWAPDVNNGGRPLKDANGQPIINDRSKGKCAITKYNYTTENIKGLLSQITDPEGNITHHTYDKYGNVIASWVEDSVINPGSTKKTIYQYFTRYLNDGVSIEVQYGKLPGVNDVVLGTKIVVTSPEGYITASYYDNNQNLEKIENYTQGSTNIRTTRIVYDAQNRKIQEISPNEYNPNDDDLIHHKYNDTTKGDRLTYWPNGEIKTKIDAEGHNTSYTYDKFSRKVEKETRDNGSEYYYDYDVMGNLQRIWFKNNKVNPDTSKILIEEYVANANNDVAEVRDTMALVDNSDGYTKEYSMNNNGVLSQGSKVIKIHKKYFNKKSDGTTDTSQYSKTVFVYDYAGRLVKTIYPDNTFTKTIYNENGTKQASQDSNGNKSYFAYDSLNRLTDKWLPFETDKNENIKYSYSKTKYDDAGRVLIEIAKIQTITLPSEIKAQTLPNSLSKDDYICKNYTYFNNGKVASSFDNEGRKTKYTYDCDGNLTGEYKFLVNTLTTGLPATVTEAQLITYSYNDNHLPGKPDHKTEYIAGKDLYGNSTSDSNIVSLTTDYTYDKNGNLYTVTTPQYGPSGNERITTTYSYDKLNRKTSIKQPNWYVDQDGTYKYGDISNSTVYNWEGKIDHTTDNNGNTTQYFYTPRGFVDYIKQQISTSSGLRDCITAFEYDLAGRKIIEVSPQNYEPGKTPSEMSNFTKYTYDDMDRVKTIRVKFTEKKVNVDSWTDHLVADRVVQAYLYDNNGNIIKELNALGYLDGVREAIKSGKANPTDDDAIQYGYGVEKTYNLANLVETVLDPATKDNYSNLPTKESDSQVKCAVKYSYDAIGRKTSETNAKNIQTKYTYDNAGNLLTIIKDGKLLETNTYDLVNNLKSHTDGEGNTTRYEFNSFNKARTITYPGNGSLDHNDREVIDNSIDKNEVQFQYDVFGNVMKKQDSCGTVDLYKYDNQNRELEYKQMQQDGSEELTTSNKYDKNGNKRITTDWKNIQTTNCYDELNQLISSSVTVNHITEDSNKGNPTTQTTKYEYDLNGNQTKRTDWRQNSSIDVYDPLNRLIEQRDSCYSENGNKPVLSLEYNENNVQVASYDALNNITKYTYDKNDRLLQTEDPEHHSTSQTYDELGNKESSSDGLNHTTNYYYDNFNNLKAVSYIVSGKQETTNYDYDLNGNMIMQKDANGHKTYFQYNSANKIKRKIYEGGLELGNTSYDRTKADIYQYNPARVENYKYYADGKLKEQTDRNGNTTLYEYDSHGRTTLLSVGKVSINYSYAFDDNGDYTETLQDATGTTTRVFDELNRVKKKQVTGLAAGSQYETTYQYDITSGIGVNVGEVAEIDSDPKGNTVRRVFDKAGRLKNVYKDNETTGTNYHYYPNGCLWYLEYPNGYSEVYKYWGDNLLKTLKNCKNYNSIEDRAEEVIDIYEYQYDEAHNLKQKSEKVNQTDKGATNYTYDNINQLKKVEETNTGKITEYSYDAAGNRVNETITQNGVSTSTNYNYNELNRLTDTVSLLPGDVSQKEIYSYDNNGNLTCKTTETLKPKDLQDSETFNITVGGQAGNNLGKSVCLYKYDELNRMVQANVGEHTTQYSYNGEGLRVGKTIDGKATRYLYEYDKVVLELDSQDNQIARNVIGTNLISRTVDGENLYYLYNGHADVTALLKPDGTVAGTYYYDAFGNITEQTGNVNNNITYAGYQYDEETGLYFCNARMYDPKIARFLQEDTVDGDPNDLLSLNKYTYTLNNPLKYYDPTGHWPNWSGLWSGISSFASNSWNGFSNWASDSWSNISSFASNSWNDINNSVSSAWNNTTQFIQQYGPPIGVGVLATASVIGGVALTAASAGIASPILAGAAYIAGGGLIGGGAFLGAAEIGDFWYDGQFNNGFNYYAGAYANGFTTGALMASGPALGITGGSLAGLPSRMAWNGVSEFVGSSVGQQISIGSVNFGKSFEDGLKMAVFTPAFEVGAIGLSKAWNYGSSMLEQSSFRMPEFKIPEFKTPELLTGDAYIPGVRNEIGYMYGGIDKNFGAPSIRTMLGSGVREGEATKSLLPGEGKIGTYKELIDDGVPGDNLTPHHMFSKEYIQRTFGWTEKAAKNDGLSINMEQPRVGGRHRDTFTYGRNMTDAQKDFYYSLSPRNALAFDLKNLRNIYKQDGLYKDMLPNLRQYPVEYRNYQPDWFVKR